MILPGRSAVARCRLLGIPFLLLFGFRAVLGDAAAGDFEEDVAWEAQALARDLLACGVTDQDQCEQDFIEFCVQRNGGWTTYASVLCETARHDFWMARHKALYPSLLEILKSRSETEAEALMSRFSSWERYSELRCGRYGAMDGTMWRVVGASCRAQMAKLLAEDTESDALIAGMDSAVTVDWNRDGALDIDLDCDGASETLMPGSAETPQGAFALVGREGEHGQTETVLVFPVDPTLQDAVCRHPISLSRHPDADGQCDALRIDDMTCDGIVVFRDTDGGDMILYRN